MTAKAVLPKLTSIIAVRVVFCFMAAVASVRGDHLPDNKRATGSPEHSIAGINVYSSSVRELVRNLGEPSARKRSPETSKRGRETGTMFYEWRLPNVRLRVATMYNCELPA